MTKRVFRHTRRRRSPIFRTLFSTGMLLAFGGGLFWQGMQWLRGNGATVNAVSQKTETVAEAIAPASVSAAEPLLLRANLVSHADGQNTGVVNRMPTEKGADFHLIAYLPGIDGVSETYAVWLLKDGLADVKRMEDLSPRADGSFVADFTADPLSGITEPDAYRMLVIMKEKRNAKEGERGEKIAEAKF